MQKATPHDVTTSRAVPASSGEARAISLETGSNLKTFATFNNNTYTSPNPSLFARTWAGGGAPGVDHSFSAWKLWSGQDAASTMNGAL